MNTLVYLKIYSIYFFNVLELINIINILVSLVGSNGIEPSTSRLSGVRSNHLSYEPMFLEFLSKFLFFRSSLFNQCTVSTLKNKQ